MLEPSANRSELATIFERTVAQALSEDCMRGCEPDITNYLVNLLVGFIHTDRLFSIKNADGAPIDSVAQMVVEGDIRQNADSFEREREVHRHIGDFILFWSALYPEFLRQLRLRHGADLITDFPRQAKESYRLVSTFDHAPFDQEAPTYRKLSNHFDEYSYCLKRVRGVLGRA